MGSDFSLKNYNRYDELGTTQFVTLVLGSDGVHNLLVYKEKY